VGVEQPEELNQEGLAAFALRAGARDGTPVVMLNLIAFKGDGGQEVYGEYAAAVAPLLERIGGRIVFAGAPAPALLGEGSWDLVALVEYPTRNAFLEMVGSQEYDAVSHLRTEAVERSELHPIDPVEVNL
jgi:uncharacterized protein (DUF1330 family)